MGLLIAFRLIVLAIFLLLPFAVNSAIHHQLKVSIMPAKHHVSVTNIISLEPQASNKISFVLHGGLTVNSPDASLRDVGKITDYVIPLNKYEIQLGDGQKQFTLVYSGEIYHPVEQLSEEYARSFSETPGIIGEQGVFLAQSSFWYPVIENELITFSMEVQLPSPWQSVSQGDRKKHDKDSSTSTITWDEKTPQEEIYLTAAPYTLYQQAAGAVKAMVYLFNPDAGLAQKYLDATTQYIEMYRTLIGPYPYSKFALVENFWETGYGMPSFTLLGSTVIRLPFIISTSYPHEILHNWWGNSVYVDYQTGNWAEGLTAYLSDHLTREQRGQASQYRRQILQHYTDFVADNKDFPLTEFRSRHSSVTEAVGYGKTQMVFHMLRQKYGDEIFRRVLKQFYRKHKAKVASFDDWRQMFTDVVDEDLSGFFNQWINRTGAPQLKITSASGRIKTKGFELVVNIEQVQQDEPYNLTIPVAITVEGQQQAVQQNIQITEKQQEVIFQLSDKPLSINIDPEFDIFRRVDLNEIPPALSQAFGADKALLVLPSQADVLLLNAYRQMAETWKQTQNTGIDIKLDKELEHLPSDRAVWLFGSQNSHFNTVAEAAKQYKEILKSNNLSLQQEKLKNDSRSIVVVTRNKKNIQHAVTLVTSANEKALAGLARKLPHYRKYSYLAFEGDAPTNSLKGQFPVNSSPMRMIVKQANDTPSPVRDAALSARPALAQIPAVFSEKRMMNDIRALASEEMAGRGLGSVEIDKAANYIAKVFEEAGLTPGFSNGNDYYQTWSEYFSSIERDVSLTNVIAYLPGNNAKMKGESVVISAHYDHLGRGWPAVRKGNEGKIHYGADDNASGVAVLLELARLAGKKWRPERTIVFAAFTGEEAGFRGANYYIRNYQRFPAQKAIGVLNLDTVGRVDNNPISIFGTGTATEWPHIFRGAQFVTGVKVKPIAKDINSGDHTNFINIGIPAVQFFGTAHSDFHAPGDTIDKIDSAGLVKVAAVLKEAAEYLATRPEPLTATISVNNSPKVEKPSAQQKTGRRVSVGTIPDFDYTGEGVRITGVIPKSPAEKAGLTNGDILISINGNVIKSLADYAKHLRSLSPGDKIKLAYQRNNKVTRLEIETTAR